jgi:hypothetical protein
MKSILKWTSFAFALVAIGVSLLGIVATVEAIGSPEFMPNFVSLIIVAFIFIATGSILVCVGTFKPNKTLVIMGAIVCTVGLTMVFMTISSNVRWFNRG